MKYKIWLFGKTYSANSKTKAVIKMLRDWSYIPTAAFITKHDSSGRIIDIIELGRC